jgi:hypothetical protein
MELASASKLASQAAFHGGMLPACQGCTKLAITFLESSRTCLEVQKIRRFNTVPGNCQCALDRQAGSLLRGLHDLAACNYRGRFADEWGYSVNNDCIKYADIADG